MVRKSIKDVASITTSVDNLLALHSGDREHTPRTLLVWRILTPISWLLVLISSFYYTFKAPNHHHRRNSHQRQDWHNRTIWGQNDVHHTPFSLNPVITSIYWIVLYITQAGFIYNLFAPHGYVTSAINLAPSFTLNNLLGFGFINLWTRGYFWWALVLLVINFFNLTFTYFRFPKSPRLQHIAALAGPLAFNFVALYWTGAAAFNARHLPARVVANVFIWSWLFYGGFYLFTFKDWSFGFALSILTAALGVSQFLTVIVAIQWIFAFTIMAILFIVSLIVAFPNATGIDVGRGHVVDQDRERAPLLANEA